MENEDSILRHFLEIIGKNGEMENQIIQSLPEHDWDSRFALDFLANEDLAKIMSTDTAFLGGTCGEVFAEKKM